MPPLLGSDFSYESLVVWWAFTLYTNDNSLLSLYIYPLQENTPLSTLPISSFKTIADQVYKDSQGLSDDSKRAFETDMRYWAGYLEPA